MSVSIAQSLLFHRGNGHGTQITSVQLSGSNVQFASAGPYYVGTLTTNITPQTPTFNNLNGASYQIVSSGGSCSGGDTTHFQIIGDGVYTNTTNDSQLVAGTYALCITATAVGVSAKTAAFSLTEGHKVDAAANYCAANGGGSGTIASPWKAACIQAAVNASVNGDTVFLASGFWSLSSTSAGASGVTGNLVSGASTITGMSSVSGIAVGNAFTDTTTPANIFGTLAYVTAINSGCSPTPCVVFSTTANNNATGDSFTFANGNVEITNSISLVGAGSGNTFTPYGNAIYDATTNNPGTHDFCQPTLSPNITCIATTGTNTLNGPGGYVAFRGTSESSGTKCTNVAVAHLFVDGSLVTAGGSGTGTMNFRLCPGPETITDIRVLTFNNTSVPSESQFSPEQLNNLTVQNSVFAEPIDISNPGFYSAVELLNLGIGKTSLFKNNVIYQGIFNPINADSVTFTGNSLIAYGDGTAGPEYNPGFGMPGCTIAGCQANGGFTGNYHFSATNNYLYSPGEKFGTGGGINDPGSGGLVSDLNWIGNWITADMGSIAGCQWHVFGGCRTSAPVTAASYSSGTFTFTTAANIGISTGNSFRTSSTFSPSGYAGQWTASSGTSCGSGGCTLVTNCGGSCSDPGASPATTLGTAGPADSADGNQINGSGGPGGNCTIDLSGTCFNVSNNSIIATTNAILDATGNGINDPTSPNPNYANTTVNFNAHQNYMASPGNQYLSDVNSINPHVTGNYCAGGSTFTQTDSTTCATTGFTTPPTVSFMLGLLEEPGGAYDVPFSATNFTAQYGAVQWLASTSPTTPTSGGQSGTHCNGSACAWSYVPPVYLAGVNHGDTVYMWTMDSLNHISAPAAALIP